MKGVGEVSRNPKFPQQKKLFFKFFSVSKKGGASHNPNTKWVYYRNWVFLDILANILYIGVGPCHLIWWQPGRVMLFKRFEKPVF